MKKSAFTLAEVLITLAIIGVVAAMTIPSLMNQTGDQEYRVGAKKALSVLAQAATMNYALYGVDYSNMTADGTSNNTLSLIFKGRLNVANDSATWTNDATKLTNTYQLADGMLITFKDIKGASAKGTTVYVYVDVNGSKGPNTLTNSSTPKDIYKIDLWNQTAAIEDATVAAAISK